MATVAWMEWVVLRGILYVIMVGSVPSLIFSSIDHPGHYVSGITFVLCLGFLAASSRGNNHETEKSLRPTMASRAVEREPLV